LDLKHPLSGIGFVFSSQFRGGGSYGPQSPFRPQSFPFKRSDFDKKPRSGFASANRVKENRAKNAPQDSAEELEIRNSIPLALWEDHLSALDNLGYGRLEAQKALQQVQLRGSPLSVEQLIREVLRLLSGQTP